MSYKKSDNPSGKTNGTTKRTPYGNPEGKSKIPYGWAEGQSKTPYARKNGQVSTPYAKTDNKSKSASNAKKDNKPKSASYTKTDSKSKSASYTKTDSKSKSVSYSKTDDKPKVKSYSAMFSAPSGAQLGIPTGAPADKPTNEKTDNSEDRKTIREGSELKTVDKRVFEIFLSIAVFSVLAFLLSRYSRFSISFLPKFISIDYSVFAELLASIAYGPIIGVAVCLIKSVLRWFFTNEAYFSVITNFVTNSLFVGIAGLYYFKAVTPNKKRKKQEEKEVHRRKTILVGSLLGMIPAVIAQFILTNTFVFPMFNKLYGDMCYSLNDIFSYYAQSVSAVSPRLPHALSSLLSKVSSLWQYTVLINAPVTLFKFLTVTIVLAVIYPYISPYIHLRFKRK